MNTAGENAFAQRTLHVIDKYLKGHAGPWHLQELYVLESRRQDRRMSIILCFQIYVFLLPFKKKKSYHLRFGLFLCSEEYYGIQTESLPNEVLKNHKNEYQKSNHVLICRLRFRSLNGRLGHFHSPCLKMAQLL